MTKDLEETLAELGPGYRELVGRVQAAYRPAGVSACGPSGTAVPAPQSVAASPSRRGLVMRWTAAYLVAASLLVFLGLGALFREPEVRDASAAKLVYTVAYAPDAAALASIVASQRADGSWANDFLTRQNAAALAEASDGESRIAYRKALRYLRQKGLRPLSAEELRDRSDAAARRLSAG